jgi:hypothetical protein
MKLTHDFHMLLKTLLPVINYGIIATSVLCSLMRYMLSRYCTLCTYSISSGPWNCRSVKYCPLHSRLEFLEPSDTFGKWSYLCVPDWRFSLLPLTSSLSNLCSLICADSYWHGQSWQAADHIISFFFPFFLVLAGHIFEFQCRIGHTSISFWI